MHEWGHFVSGGPATSTDGDFVTELIALVDSGVQHQLLVDFATRIASDILVAAAHAGIAPVPIPVDDDGAVDSRELVELFLQDVRPSHEAHDYLDDYWNFIWEAAWPEGLAYALLGTSTIDGFMAAELMGEIERQAEEIGLSESPPFDAVDLEVFIAKWRRKFVSALAKLAAGT